MMPNNYHFLLRYAYQNNDDKIKEFVNITLTKMAYGGVFDQIFGGFSRYSIDEKWHIPHFEKMLYDNAQLVSLYSDAYLVTKNKLYKDIVTKTLEYIKIEMTSKSGAFYSSLDADSKTVHNKHEEGAFYVWQKDELKKILKDEYLLFSAYYNINEYGFWEDEKYVLIRNTSDSSFTKKHKIIKEDLIDKVKNWNSILLKERYKRQKPRLDDKTLTSWNALLLKGYVDAYRVFGDKEYLKIAQKNARFLIKNQLRKDGGLNHNFKNGISNINGYLKDYATLIDAFLSLYESSLNEIWLFKAKDLTNYIFKHFINKKNSMFYETSIEDQLLISRNTEYRDNVIPSSNSMMAKNLFKLSHYFDNQIYKETAFTMLNNVKPEIQNYPSGYTNWLDLMLNTSLPFYEIAIVGKDAKQKLKEINTFYIPNKIITASLTENNLPLLENRFIPNKTLIYVCIDKTCRLPVNEVNEAIKLITNQ